MRKGILAALAVVLVLGAVVPVFAELNGTWAGEGEGVCYPPFPTPYVYPIYAWQNWKGEVEDNEVFYGKWEDDAGNYGRFKGEIILWSLTTAYCKGEWTWINPFVDPPQEITMGKFEMSFNYIEEICKGEWYCAHSPSVRPGRMKGERIGD